MDAYSPTVPLPATPLGWVRFLWSRILFPGSTLPSEPIQVRSLLILLVLPAILLYPCTSFWLFEPDESRYAQIPVEMMQRGDLVLPTLQGENYLEEPPLLYWLVMASYQVFGIHDWSARLVPALAVHLTILATYLFGRRLLGERAGLWGALLLLLAPGFIGLGRLLILDGLFTLWITLALFAGFEAIRGTQLRWGWWLLAGLACGLGVLTRGPVALLLVLGPLLLHRQLSGQGCQAGWKGYSTFALVVFAVSLPWYVALCTRIPGYTSHLLWEHNVSQFLPGQAQGHSGWYYIPVVLLLLLPGSLLAWPCARFLFSNQEEFARQRPAELGFMLLASVWGLFFFSMSSSKLPTYILPLLPMLALTLGYCFTRSSWEASRIPGIVGGVTFAGLLMANYLVIPWYAAARSPMNGPADVLSACFDPETSVVCYPYNCDSLAFYCRRSDFKAYKNKDIDDLRSLVRNRHRTVILCTHRHALDGLYEMLPPEATVRDTARLSASNLDNMPKWATHPLEHSLRDTSVGLRDLLVLEPGPADQPLPPPAPRLRMYPRIQERQSSPLLSVPGVKR